jgi:drug/metabolite transporter (DMT)-like permease
MGVPLSVAVGNVVRARLWPERSQPLPNAAGAMTAGAVLLGAAALTTGAVQGLGTVLTVWPVALMHAAASASGFLLFFVLQRIAGPVYTSQVGYVATAVALAAAALVFGEPIALLVYAAVAVIVAGVVLVSTSR